MIDTRQLMNKITDFRKRLEAMPKLLPDASPSLEVAASSSPPSVESELEKRVRAGSRTQELLQDSLRVLTPNLAGETPVPKRLTARARRLMTEAREHLDLLRTLADHPLLQGPPGEINGEIDVAALHFQETSSLLESAIRMASALPELPSAQLRLCDGLEGILNAVRDRLILLHELLTRRREDVEMIDTLSLILHRISQGEPVGVDNLIQLVDRLLAENLGGPLRLLELNPETTQLYLGGTTYPAPTRYVAVHSLNVARVLARLVIHDREWRDNLREPLLAALVKNVGMIRLGTELLGSPRVLTDDQRRQLELHPRYSIELLEVSTPELQPLFPAILQHHERLNGTGYAQGIPREKIVPLARLLAVVDCYVALCSPRPYRLAIDPRTALTDTLMLAESGLLDRFEAQKLLRLSFYPIGSVVEISDGSIGVVVSNHSEPFQLHSALRPVVAVLVDSDSRPLPAPRHVDLFETMQGTVLRALRREERASLLARQYPMWVG